MEKNQKLAQSGKKRTEMWRTRSIYGSKRAHDLAKKLDRDRKRAERLRLSTLYANDPIAAELRKQKKTKRKQLQRKKQKGKENVDKVTKKKRKSPSVCDPA